MSPLPVSLVANPLLSRWIRIERDGTINVRTGKVELGQGSVTAIAAIAARELGVDVAALTINAGDTRAGPDEGMTAGSLSIEHGGAAMKWVSAQVRELFIAAAAERLKCPSDTVILAQGRFSAPGRNESLSYGDLTGAVDLERPAAGLPAPDQSFTGAPEQAQRLDLAAKLTGGAFIQDMQRPDLHHGRVLRPPMPGATLASIDRAGLDALAGVATIVIDGSFIGIVAGREDDADRAMAAAQKLVRWSLAALPECDDENLWLESIAPISVLPVAHDGGEPQPAALRHEAAYSRPYIAHASIGTSTALAEWRGGGLTVWSHTQGVYPLRAQLCRALDLPIDRVDVIHAMGAGCYGHNGADDVALDAALLARKAGVPVLCRWSRADELTWSPFGAPMRMRLSAGLDANGRILDWSHDVWSPPHVSRPGFGDGVNLLAAWSLEHPKAPAPAANFAGPAGGGDRNAVPLYRVGKRRITHHLLPQGPLRSSALRSLGAHGNIFAIESFMDELAARAGADPVEFRLAHLDDPRAKAVIRSAADASGWNAYDEGGEGAGRGIAFARYKNMGGYCAVVARVEISEKVAVTDVFAAVDCGTVMNRDGLLNQIEGGIIQAASWTLKEQVRWTAEGVSARSWGDYPILNFSECPRISITVLEAAGASPLGAGECATGPVAGAIANAIAHALGVRVRHMPLTTERIQAAINAQPD